MKPHRSIYFLQRADGDGYRQVSRSECHRLREAGKIRLEGADGNEQENTVTYWYERAVEE